jgi:putative spermidine/putrescine transport system ATP-binding protein
MSDRIAVFSDGMIQQIATPSRLYEQPANSFVAQFIGENNRLSGRIVHMNGVSCTVAVNGGSTVEAMTANVPGLGADTTISLRPERVKINPTDGICSNRFKATVSELIYLGDHTRIRCAVCGQDDFIAKVPNAEGVPGLMPGEIIEIGWKKEDCLALDAH